MLDQQHPVGLPSGASGTSLASYSLLAQTFTAGRDGTLSQLDLSIYLLPDATGDIELTLLPTDGGMPDPDPGNALFSTTIALSSIDDLSPSNLFTVSVDLSSAELSLSEGEMYAWALDRPGALGADVFVQRGGEYTGGARFERSSSGDDWTLNSLGDFFFQTYIDVAGTSGEVTINPGVTAQVELSTGGFTLTQDPAALVAQQALSEGVDLRGLIEYPLSSLPDGARITSATLEADVSAFTYSGSVYPEITVFGYEGDGVAQLGDAAITADLLGVSGPITDTGPVSIDLDTQFIQDLLATGSQAGLLLVGDANGEQAGLGNNASPPVLNIEFDYPVSGYDLDLDGDVDITDLMIWQREDGSSEGLTGWEDAFGVGAPAGAVAAVPEPGGLVWFGVLLLAGVRRHWV